MSGRKKQQLRFRQHEAERLIRAAERTGHRVRGIELRVDGSLAILTVDSAEESTATAGSLGANPGVNEWDRL